MNYSFEYIDIILLAMIAGFIFLRLRGILGKRTGFDGKLSTDFKQEFSTKTIKKNLENQIFDDINCSNISGFGNYFIHRSGNGPRTSQATIGLRTVGRT